MHDTTDRLRALDRAEPPDLWRSVMTRVPRATPELDRSPARPGAKAMVVVAAIAISALTVWFVATAFAPVGNTPVLSESPAATSPVPTFDGWTVAASLERRRFGPLEISLGPIRSVKPNDAHVWVQHRFTITNVGDRPVVLSDLRTSAFLGPPAKSLIAADWSCGWSAAGPHRPVHVDACTADLQVHALQPGKSISRPISLLKELPGMHALTDGVYRFRQPVGYDVQGDIGGLVHQTEVTISYSIGRPAEASPSAASR